MIKITGGRGDLLFYSDPSKKALKISKLSKEYPLKNADLSNCEIVYDIIEIEFLNKQSLNNFINILKTLRKKD